MIDSREVVECRLYANHLAEIYRRCHGTTHHQTGEHVFQHWRIPVNTEAGSNYSRVEEVWVRSVRHGKLQADYELEHGVQNTGEAGTQMLAAPRDVNRKFYRVSVGIPNWTLD